MRQISINDDGFTRDVVIYAFRYALGRESVAVSILIDWVKANSHLLTVQDAKQFIKEINEEEDRGYLGNETIDKPKWLQFREYLTALVIVRENKKDTQ